jgi:hypothetical protein
MTPTLPPPAVRVLLSCGSLEEYRERLEPRYAANGIFIPSGRIRSRPVGSRIQLKLELGDGTLAYSGGAVVAAVVEAQERPGCILSLDRAGAPPRPDAVTVELELAAPGLAASDDVAADGIERGAPELAGDGAASPGPAPAVQRHPVSLRLLPTPTPALATVTAPLPVRSRAPHPARRLAIALAAIAATLACAAGGAALVRAHRRAAVVEAAFSDAIREADDRLRAGRLALPLGDAALDHLLTARALRPRDGRVETRLEMLADTFESLARRAVVRGDLDEAAAHLGGTLRADPRRDWARGELERVESRRRAQQVRQRQEQDKGTGASG